MACLGADFVFGLGAINSQQTDLAFQQLHFSCIASLYGVSQLAFIPQETIQSRILRKDRHNLLQPSATHATTSPAEQTATKNVAFSFSAANSWPASAPPMALPLVTPIRRRTNLISMDHSIGSGQKGNRMC